jgi:hypothetical protein
MELLEKKEREKGGQFETTQRKDRKEEEEKK